VIQQGKTGFLVDPEEPGELTEAILRLWSDKELAIRLGQAGKERVEREFTWQGLSLQYLDEFNSLL
jgi:phosphatidylinositol alpha-1,6-mannosyltransferase